ncbi:MAG: hypothetical protein EBR82_25980 [Caulobacteraceae bacterium]|nr:hypothetical protein [Caulobacteraceae bacterium]
MKIKTDDLRMLMEYADKEFVEEVDVTLVSNNFAVYFAFTDAEGRECEIAVFDKYLHDKPAQLTKKMELKTRTKKESN